MLPRLPLLLAWLLLMPFAAPAQADKLLRYEAEPGSVGEPMNILVRAPHVRMESRGYAMVYDSDTEQTFVLDLAERTYYRMTRERADQLADQMQAAQQQMQQIMEQAKSVMSDEQRQQLEQYMSNSGVGVMQKAPDLALRSSGRTARIHELDCEWMEMLMDGNPISELCIARSADMGMSGAEQHAVERLSELLLAMGNRFSKTSLERRPDGIPVGLTDFQKNERIQLISIEDGPLDASLFEVPPGFKPMSLFPGQ